MKNIGMATEHRLFNTYKWYVMSHGPRMRVWCALNSKEPSPITSSCVQYKVTWQAKERLLQDNKFLTIKITILKSTKSHLNHGHIINDDTDINKFKQCHIILSREHNFGRKSIINLGRFFKCVYKWFVFVLKYEPP